LNYFEIRSIKFIVKQFGVNRIESTTPRGISIYGLHINNVRDYKLNKVTIQVGSASDGSNGTAGA